MTEPAPNMATVLMTVMDTVTAISEAVDGYKKQCEERGYSPTASELMALQLHEGLMKQTFRVTT